MKEIRSGRAIVIAGLVLLALAAFSVSSEAQTRRTPGIKPTPTATPPAGDAEIIRTADQPELTNVIVAPIESTAEVQTDPNAQKVKELNARVKKLEAARSDPYDERQRRLLLNLDILTRAEGRSEALRRQLFEMIEKENSVKSRLDQIEFDTRPEMISRSATYAGSMRPEEVREMRKKSLDAEKLNLQTLLTEIQNTRTSLTANLDRSDALVEKLRSKLEKDIDNSFKDEEPER